MSKEQLAAEAGQAAADVQMEEQPSAASEAAEITLGVAPAAASSSVPTEVAAAADVRMASAASGAQAPAGPREAKRQMFREALRHLAALPMLHEDDSASLDVMD